MAYLLESPDGLSFFIGLSPKSNSNASLGLEGADGDLNEDSIGVTGLGSPAGNDVEGNAFIFSSVSSSAKRTFCFLLDVATPLGFLSPPPLFIASTRIRFPAGLESPFVLGMVILLSLKHFPLQKLSP